LSFVLFGKPVISKELLAQKGILNEEHIELKQTKNCDQELLFSEELDKLKEKEKEIVSMTDLEFLNNSKENEELSNKEIEVEYNEINLEDSEIEYENNDKDELSDELSDDLSDELLNKKIRGNTKVAYNGQAQIKTRIRRLACMCPNCKNGVRGQINIADGKPIKKKHNCHIPGCNKIYGKTSHLRAHLLWHDDEKSFVCNWISCGKKFTRSDELQRHRRTHTGEKRFACSECNKKFMRRDHLSKHVKTHQKSSSLGLPNLPTSSADTNLDNIIIIAKADQN
jgi:uncharacterized Zn-finger protein